MNRKTEKIADLLYDMLMSGGGDKDTIELYARTIARQFGAVEDTRTLRDYFAGQALIAMGASAMQQTEETAAVTAERAYTYADAMLAERERNR